jgi:NAD(P)-dependent dehydrogenase (short-subunit alcohol dehydrogenase family)
MSKDPSDLSGRIAVVTGASGVLGSGMARTLAGAGATVVAVARNLSRLEDVVASVSDGGRVIALAADVTDRNSLRNLREEVRERVGVPDILVNGAGGNVPGATLPDGGDVFELAATSVREAMDLNYFGALLTTQSFGEDLMSGGGASIVNVSSMTAHRAVSRVIGYGGAKAALENLTRWLAVELAKRSHGSVRVNAIAPGFYVGNQNRSLLLDHDGRPTVRGQRILDHTPAGRFGVADDLAGTLLWLCGDGSRFVTGVVIPVDGGFSAYSGV